METNKKITLAHGSGGRLMHSLIKELFLKELGNPILNILSDSAILKNFGRNLAYTTDSFVVKPLFFPGGDIGRLSVFGTVNDLAVSGARPLYIACAIIMEEGLEYSILEKVIGSIKEAIRECGVELVTGDTKVVEKGGVDSLFINTSGIGEILDGCALSPKIIQPQDKVIINGNIADHGMSIFSARENLGFYSEIKSDCANLWDLIQTILSNFRDSIKFMRDPTRGGLATTLNEISQLCGLSILVDEKEIPIAEDTKALCEILGFDPLHIANEGKVVLIVDEDGSEKVLDIIRKHPLGKNSKIIGEVISEQKSRVYLKSLTGGTRILDMLTYEQLPRIC